MGKVISIHSDDVLVVETEGGVRRYAAGDYISIGTKEGFTAGGVISSITPSSVQIAAENSYLEYSFDEIVNIK